MAAPGGSAISLLHHPVGHYPYTVFYNFCRVHKTLRVTPAMQAGLTDYLWDMEEVAGYMDALTPKPAKRGPYKKREPKISN